MSLCGSIRLIVVLYSPFVKGSLSWRTVHCFNKVTENIYYSPILSSKSFGTFGSYYLINPPNLTYKSL